MTTSNSPSEQLLSQAKRIVQTLKAFNWPNGKQDLKFGLVMDDKVLMITFSKDIIVKNSPASLEAMIFAHMRGETFQ